MADPTPPTALLSVFDKAGVVDLAQSLADLGWRLVSSGGTARAIADARIEVTDVADLTGYPAMLGHRVVTLHPVVHGGILADRSDPSHVADLETYGIAPIDLVIANLYPFSSDPSIELIDIGGPAMVRASAKNHAHVGIVVDPADYGTVIAELRSSGALSPQSRHRLARKAFAHTAAYDAAVVAWFDESDVDERAGDEPAADVLPPTLHLAAERMQVLRYGENPHQVGARYRFTGQQSWWDNAEQLGGKEMSYLNVYDTEAAWRLVHALGDDSPAAVVIKHANPCGAAVAADISAAYRLAHQGDEVSAFGGIVALNRPVPLQLAEALSGIFTEVVVAPSFEPDALAQLQEKKNLRILAAPAPSEAALELRSIDGGLLVQTPDRVTLDRTQWTIATHRAPTETEWNDLVFAWRVCARVVSNTIVLVKGGQAVGIGAGQQNRRDAGRIAAEKAAGRAVGGACASDAFFPFRDGLDAAIDAGATAVIQPGGSVRDGEVIDAANEAGIAMVFTGERHFRH